jgi:hypothetical protein
MRNADGRSIYDGGATDGGWVHTGGAYLNLAIQELLLEQVVFANVRAHHLSDLLGLEEWTCQSNAKSIGAGSSAVDRADRLRSATHTEPALRSAHVGADHREVGNAFRYECTDEVLRHAREAKSADEQLGAVGHVGDGRFRRSENLRPACRAEAA